MRTRRSWRNQERLYKSIGRELARAAAAAEACFVETRVPSVMLAWTREGCNEWKDGRFVPYPDHAAARAAIHARQTDRKVFDDPMWASAEYRIVPRERKSDTMNPQIVFTPPRQLPDATGGWATWARALEELGFCALYGTPYSYERKLKDGVVLQAVLVPPERPDPAAPMRCRIGVLSRYADGDERELCALHVAAPEALAGALELPKKKGKLR